MRAAVLSCCVAAAALVLAIDPPRNVHQPTDNGKKLLTYNETVTAPALVPSTKSVQWAATGADGDFITQASDGALVFENVVSGNKTTFLAADKRPAGDYDHWISHDLSKVLWAVNYTKQYRYSFFATYLVQDVKTGETQPLVEDATDIQYAVWNPVSSSQIAFVRENNLFVWDNGKVNQITTNGGPDMFNAVPDWVYEEEIFGSNSALWYSPDGEYIAYLSFNETGVETFTIPYYMDDNSLPEAPSYPRELELRYPKVGTKNPTVAFNLLRLSDLKTSELSVTSWPEDDLVIGEIAWLTNDHDKVLYRAYNRVQDQEKRVVVDTASGASTVTRERDGSDGWLDQNMAISYVGDVNGTRYYLDMDDASGWNHIYLMSIDGKQRIPLTSGNWEVVSILKIDKSRGLVYFTSTERHSTERHLYSVSFLTGLKTPLVDDTIPAVWTASFSTGGSYYILRYSGPDVPYQELYTITSPNKPLRTIVDNAALITKLQSYLLPNITYLEIPLPSSNLTMNAMLRLPADFSPKKKYPLLLTPYGGPSSQRASKSYARPDWAAYIASDPELQYITLTVDNRGTGYKGRAFRSVVTSNLGELEALDQIHAAKYISKLYPFIDASHIGIWGWSYGGYLTAKVLEVNDPIISFGVSTAPVSDWRLYDSLYTERYMKDPKTNAEGYNRSAVRKTEGFKQLAGSYLVQHGTGDDNVHFQNGAALVDLLMGAGVGPEKLEATFFTDSDHSINRNKQGVYLYKQLTGWLWREKERKPEGKGKGKGHQWGKKRREVALEGKA